ncbi:hypothetical protein GGR57DRAFT_497890 [Xylariaceae sp. FL1272]|nr:hypothetical protein GGR57DRAFT_497890 [Xylariaceae sp. FL1272]
MALTETRPLPRAWIYPRLDPNYILCVAVAVSAVSRLLDEEGKTPSASAFQNPINEPSVGDYGHGFCAESQNPAASPVGRLHVAGRADAVVLKQMSESRI